MTMDLTRNRANNFGLKSIPRLLLRIMVLGLVLWGIDSSTGILTAEHLQNQEHMALRHGPGHPLYEEMVDDLISDTKSSEQWKRKIAAKDLGQLGNGASRAVPNLKQLLEDEALDVRTEAAIALAKISSVKSDQ